MLKRISAIVAAVLVPSATCLTTAHAQTVEAVPSVACGMHQRLVRQSYGGVWVYSRPNPFNAGQPPKYCIKQNGTPGFRIQSAVSGNRSVQAYPFTGVGCAYSLCSRGTDLPRRVSGLSSGIDSSWTWRGSAGGSWNASYDIWFDTHDQKTQQNDGAELMIWLRTMPGYDLGRQVSVNGRRYWFTSWRTSHQGKSWNYVQFRFPGTVHSVGHLKLMPFIRYAERQGLIRSGWWMTSVHAGYEIWNGGKGLQTTWFNAHT